MIGLPTKDQLVADIRRQAMRGRDLCREPAVSKKLGLMGAARCMSAFVRIIHWCDFGDRWDEDVVEEMGVRCRRLYDLVRGIVSG